MCKELDNETEELKDMHDMLVGAPLGYAIDSAKDLAPWLTIRVMRKDGERCIGTADYNPDRVNVAVEGDKITAIIGIG